MKIEIKGFTPEQTSDFQKAFDSLSDEMQNAVADKIKGLAGKEALEEVKGLLKTDDGKDKFSELQKSIDDLVLDVKKFEGMKKKEEKEMTLDQSVKELISSDEFKNAKKDGFRSKSNFEIKADTSDITGTVNMTRQNLSVNFGPERAISFLTQVNTGTVGQDKNRILWVEGAYTSNVGYVGEGTGQATADAGTATEKTRAMAKISAKLPLTAELLEDADYIASAFRMKMQERALQFTDLEVYSGDGSDGVNPNHIYGIVGHATAYSATTTGANDGVNGTIANANIGDLVDDAILQAELSEQRGLDTLAIHPKTFQKFKYAKATDGQYLFVKDVNGNYTISGLRVIKSTAVTANTLTVYDSMKVQLWWKRNVEVKFSQMNGTDFVDDAYTAVLFLRAQVLVEGPDKTALIHVADVDASITAITAP
jgi:HK97 family phage major capsid protein